MASLPTELLDLILSWHMPICAQQFTGNPHYTLYWCYDKGALREILGMTRDQYKVVQSSLGQFMRRVPQTSNWLTNFQNPQAGGWALQGLTPSGSNRALAPGGAADRRPIARKSYVGLPAPGIEQFDGL